MTKHFHICQECLAVWSHETVKGEQRRAVHTCKCGAGPYYEAFSEKDVALEKRWYQGEVHVSKEVKYGE